MLLLCIVTDLQVEMKDLTESCEVPRTRYIVAVHLVLWLRHLTVSVKNNWVWLWESYSISNNAWGWRSLYNGESFLLFFIFGWLVVRYYTNCIKAPRFHFRLAARSALVLITMMMLAVLGWQWNSNQRQQPAELETEQEEKSNACHNVTHHGRHHYHRGRCHH